jgi:tetratricopeptide (TPR) repeat protein
MTASQGAGPAAAYQKALALCQAGRLSEAEPILKELVTAAPGYVDAVQLLGITISSLGRVDESLAWFDRARDLRPGNATILHNRAQTLFRLGRLAEARAQIEQVLNLRSDLQPAWNLLGSVLGAMGDQAGAQAAHRRALEQAVGDAQAHYNLAVSNHEAGRLDEAMAGYQKALSLNRAFPEALVNLANIFKVRGRIDEALAHYAEALRIDPEFADALSNFGTALRETGRVGEALPLLERAARLKPGSEAIHNNLGIAYFERNRFAEAVESYRRALAIRPTFAEALNNLGNSLSALGRQDEALACYREVIEKAPNMPHAHSNMGVILQERGEVEEAIACYERALAIQPDHHDAINNVGYLLQEQGRRREAMERYARALAVNPAYARAAYNLGLAHLCEFEFGQGWKLHDARYRTVPPIAVARPFAIARFTSADLDQGRRVAVWREQGVGDQLLYSTLVPELEPRVKAFVLEVDARLIAAFKRAHPAWNVVSPEQSGAAFADCDRHASLGTLAEILRPTLASFANQPGSLLAADPARAQAYRERLAAPGARRVGISWRSFQPSARGYVQRKKSAPLEAFGKLSGRADLRLVDLQYGDTAVERETFAQGGGKLARLDDLDLFNDLDGVLAAIEACDVVVTTSNVTAHLAGVLGKRTLLVYLAANPPFYYWVPGADGRSLWYPSVQIVTGRELDTWEKAFARVAAILGA